jgi:2-keto-4-pentenoate hydratase/2-oxohepta-3-ene-1,7-dioic acid hydratase in catechol pathway
MRLVSYRGQGEERGGIQTGGGVIDAADLLGREAVSVRELLSENQIPVLRDRLPGTDLEPIPDAEPLPPVTDPDKIVCIGLNYRSHAAEAGIDPPGEPTFFAKFRNALAPPGATVELPAASERVDYEAEIAFVVGRRCKDVPPDEALDAIAGYLLLNDLSRGTSSSRLPSGCRARSSTAPRRVGRRWSPPTRPATPARSRSRST